MSGFESFSAPESANQGATAESFKLFQERMKVASAQIQASRQSEQKQKKKEDQLANILTDFIKNANDDHLIDLISKLLGFNLPAVFVLSLIIINFPELSEKAGITLISYDTALHAGTLENSTLPDIYFKNQLLPLEIKINIESWIAQISKSASETHPKSSDHALRLDGKVKTEIIDLAAYCLELYLNGKSQYNLPESNYKFLELCLNGIFKDLNKKNLLLN